MKSADRKSTQIAAERRGASRHEIAIGVNFLMPDEVEGSGQLLDISESGLALITDAPVKVGEKLILYPEGMGRFCGVVARTFRGGFAVKFSLGRDQAQTMKSRIDAAIKGVPYLRLAEKRSAVRLRYDIETQLRTGEDGKWVDCRIIDMSRLGCRVACELKPKIGETVHIGALTGIVKRVLSNGFAVEFVSALRGREDQNMHLESAELNEKAPLT